MCNEGQGLSKIVVGQAQIIFYYTPQICLQSTWFYELKINGTASTSVAVSLKWPQAMNCYTAVLALKLHQTCQLSHDAREYKSTHLFFQFYLQK